MNIKTILDKCPSLLAVIVHSAKFITISYLTGKDVATIQDEAIKEAQITVKLSTCVSATRITGYVESSVIDVT